LPLTAVRPGGVIEAVNSLPFARAMVSDPMVAGGVKVSDVTVIMQGLFGKPCVVVGGFSIELLSALSAAGLGDSFGLSVEFLVGPSLSVGLPTWVPQDEMIGKLEQQTKTVFNKYDKKDGDFILASRYF
jgi:hypothetical protein